MITKDMLLKDNSFIQKVHLRKKSRKQNDGTRSYFKMICCFLHHSLSHQSPLISPRLCPPTPHPPPTFSWSLLTHVPVFISETTVMASVTLRPIWRPSGQTRPSVSCFRPPCRYKPRGGGGGGGFGGASNAGKALGSSGSGHAQRLVCSGQRMRWTDQTNA